MSSPLRALPWATAAIFGLWLGLRPSGPAAPLEVDRVHQRSIARGVELVEVELRRGARPAGRWIALHIDRDHVSPTLLVNDRGRPLAQLDPRALAVMNAGFFTPDRRATGLLVSEGRVLSPFVPEAGGAGSGVFVLDRRGPRLVERDAFRSETLAKTQLAIQAGPRLIEKDGGDGIRSDDGERANRSLIGADARGRVVLAVVLGPLGWPSGPTLYEVQTLAKGSLAARLPEHRLVFALNLDGGPSTGLHVRGAEAPVDQPESAPVLSVLSVRIQEP